MSRKRELPTLLYINISCVDLWTCISQLPVLVSLFWRRAPVLFNILAVCSGWTVVFRFVLFNILAVCSGWTVVFRFVISNFVTIALVNGSMLKTLIKICKT